MSKEQVYSLDLIREEYRVRNGRLLLPIAHGILQNFLAFGCTGGSETHKNDTYYINKFIHTTSCNTQLKESVNLVFVSILCNVFCKT